MSRFFACVVLMAAAPVLAAQGTSSGTPLLPRSFAAWTAVPNKDAPGGPTGGEAAVLQEDGLSRSETAQYANGGADLIVRAWEFKDATGAYGAFTWYRQADMKPVSIGNEGAAIGDRYVIRVGATVVEATFAHPAKDETGALEGLADSLPKVAGGAGVPPALPRYLPGTGLDTSSVKYAIGPAAYAPMGGALPAAAIDFNQDAEALTAQYEVKGAQGTLTLVMYPTPQMAAGHLKALEAQAQQGHGIGGLAKRTGPLLAVVSGNLPAQTANALLDAIQFNDTVTINHPEGYVSETVKLYRLLFGITMLTVVLVGAALLLGIFLGGGRAMVRVMRGKSASVVSEEEFITLHLGE